jgi:hypothetical protein
MVEGKAGGECHARGRSAPVGDVQLHLAGEAGAEGSPAAADPGDGGSGSGRALAAVRDALRPDGPAVDRPREAAAGPAAAGALHGPQRAAADGAAGLQPAVPLVRGAERRRSGLGPDGLHQEPGSAVGGGRGPGVFRRGPGTGAGEAAALGRALHGGRDADRGVGEPQELGATGRPRAAGIGRRPGQPDGELPGASGGATRRTSRRRIPRPGLCGARGRRLGWPTKAMC